MNTSRKPHPDREVPHMEKSIMTEPMEEFVADQSVPSRSMQTKRSEPAASPQKLLTEESAHQR